MRAPKRKQQLLIVDISFFYTINKIVIEIFPLENDYWKHSELAFTFNPNLALETTHVVSDSFAKRSSCHTKSPKQK